jgi:hypothetical protein
MSGLVELACCAPSAGSKARQARNDLLKIAAGPPGLTAAFAVALAFDRGADFSTGFSQAAADVPADLVTLASGAHIVIACRAPDDFLRNTLELLAGALQLLFG